MSDHTTVVVAYLLENKVEGGQLAVVYHLRQSIKSLAFSSPAAISADELLQLFVKASVWKRIRDALPVKTGGQSRQP